MKFETPPGITNIRLTKYGGKVCIWPVLKYWNSSRALLGIMLSNNFSCRYVIHCSCVEKLMVLALCLCVKNPKWPPPRGCKKCKQNLLLPFFLIGGDYRYLQWTNKAEFVFYLINLCICKTWQKIYYNNVNWLRNKNLKKGDVLLMNADQIHYLSETHLQFYSQIRTVVRHCPHHHHSYLFGWDVNIYFTGTLSLKHC